MDNIIVSFVSYQNHYVYAIRLSFVSCSINVHQNLVMCILLSVFLEIKQLVILVKKITTLLTNQYYVFNNAEDKSKQ